MFLIFAKIVETRKKMNETWSRIKKRVSLSEEENGGRSEEDGSC